MEASAHPLMSASGNLARRRRVNKAVEIACTIAAVLAVGMLLQIGRASCRERV